MIDIGVTGTLPSADAAARTGSTAASSRSGAGGFSEVLDGAERRGGKSAVDDERSAPTVELSARSRLRTDSDAHASDDEVQAEREEQLPAKARDRGGRNSPAGFAAHAPAMARALQEALPGRGEMTTRRGAETDKPVARGLRSLVERADAAAEDDQQAESTGDALTADLGETLSLLKGVPTEVQPGLQHPDSSKGRPDRSVKGRDTTGPAVDPRLATPDQVAGDTSTGGQAPDGTDALSSGTDRTFRFARLDGKGQPLTMRMNESGDAARYETGTAPGEGTQTIAVLDARRYLAPVSTANSTNIAAAVAGDGEWARAMQPATELSDTGAATGGGKVVHTLKIQMTPIELGSVTANLRLRGDELTVHLTVENHAALRQLNDDQGDILKALRAQGLTVDHVHVSMAPAAERAGGDGGQGAGQWQQGGQQAQQGAGQGAGGGPRQDMFGNSRGEDDSSGRIGNDASVAETAGNGGGTVSGGARPDHVYL
ncbi:MAG: flagellar hook-length control protein FliK [Rhizobiaceae bacterium]|nr:flagellar hook-length control protein FliK [Rhizobiaceae bacterium]